MNIQRAKQEIKDTVEAYLLKDEHGEYEIPSVRQRPILLIGAPGIGKTQIMEQVAEECGIGLVAYTITHHTRQSAIGLPFIVEKEFQGRKMSVTEYTMSEIVASIYEKMEQTGWQEGILFLDEINCVSETLAPAMLQFLQCKSFGNHKIPAGWIIAAAGNPPEYNKSVREFDIVTLDRVKKIEVEPDFTAWKAYAYKAEIHPAVISYLNVRPQNFYRMETTVDGKSFATPRGWEDLSRLLTVYEKLKKKLDAEVVVQYIQHDQTARDFANYLELYYKYQTDYQIEAVFGGTIDPILEKKVAHASFDERLSVIGLLLAGLNSRFRAVYEKERTLEALMKLLRAYQAVPETDGIAALVAQTEGYRSDWQMKRENGVLSGQEEHIARNVTALLDAYTKELREQVKDTPLSTEACFLQIRIWFAEENDALADLQDTAGETLEHVFDFLESVFGESQELAVFMTELNASSYALSYLTEYDCERYQRYNQNFMFDENRDRLLRRIDHMENWG